MFHRNNVFLSRFLIASCQCPSELESHNYIMQIENKGKYWIQLEYVHDHQLFIKYQLFMGLIIFSETLHIGTNVKRYKMNDIQPFWRAIHALINCDLDFYLTNQISKASENTYCQLGNNQSIYLKQLSIFIILIALNVQKKFCKNSAKLCICTFCTKFSNIVQK